MVLPLNKFVASLLFLTLLAYSIEGRRKISAISKLSDKLLKGYKKYILPSERQPFPLTIDITLIAIGEIDELDEKFSSVFWFYYRWTDDSISWDVNQTDVDWITLSYLDVWTPALRVTNPHVEVSKSQSVDRSNDVVTYDSNGKAFYDEMISTRTTCDLDMTYYPFDMQKCTVQLILVGSTNEWIELYIEMKDFISEEDTNHGSWQLLNKSVTVGYGLFHIDMEFQRRPMFMLINILLPIIVLALLTPVVFVLPKNSGERVGYAITMLLAISVYMTIVSDNLPRNSQPMPLISIMIFIWYILDAIIVFVVIINTKIHSMTNTAPLPCCARYFVLLTERITSCVTCKVCRNEASGETSAGENEKCLEVSANDNTGADGKSSDTEEHVISGTPTWKDVSKSIDKWSFVISYLFKICLPVIFLTVAKVKSRSVD